MRYRVASHRTSEYKKDRRKDRRFYHRECDPEHRLELRCIKDRRCLLKVRIHIPEDPADQDIGERRIMES